MGSRGNSGRYSDVDSHTTPMSDEDKEQIGFSDARYFNSSDSFTINAVLREAADNDDDIDEVLREHVMNSFWHDESDIEKLRATIDAMDRSMSPTNKDMEVTRMADSSYLNRIMSLAGVPQDVQDSLHNALRGFTKFNQQDVDILKSYLTAGTVYESAFMSSTYNKTLSDSAFSSRSIRIDINVIKGYQKCLFT